MPTREQAFVPEDLLSPSEMLSQAGPSPTLLLGNGFSVAYSREFAYQNLHAMADLSPELRGAFTELNTHDFEEVLQWFAVSQRILRSLDLLGTAEREMDAFAGQVRQAMIKALTSANPRSFGNITASERAAVARFLEPFGNIFTLCYDLLLYWISVSMKKGDAFRPRPTGGSRWDISKKCEVHWLHGGFHLYDQHDHTYKIVQKSGASDLRSQNNALLDKIRQNIEYGIVPLIVVEGNASEKRVTIARNNYLRACFARLTATRGAVATLGASFHEDAHILEAIVQGNADKIFIGVHGEKNLRDFLQRYPDVSGDRNKWISASGAVARPLRVAFWDTTSDTLIWGRPPLSSSR